MIEANVNNQLSFLESNERRILRNYQSGNAKDTEVQLVLSRITNPVSGTSEGSKKGSEMMRRVRAVVNKIREGRAVSLDSLV